MNNSHSCFNCISFTWEWWNINVFIGYLCFFFSKMRIYALCPSVFNTMLFLTCFTNIFPSLLIIILAIQNCYNSYYLATLSHMNLSFNIICTRLFPLTTCLLYFSTPIVSFFTFTSLISLKFILVEVIRRAPVLFLFPKSNQWY